MNRFIDENLMKYENKFYKLMVEYLGEEILVADKSGKILFANPASSKAIGLPVDQIIGRTTQELQGKGYFSASATAEVLKQRKMANVLQTLKDGRTVLATGVPIFDDGEEEIIMVIVTSKDVDEVNRLLETVQKHERELLLKNAEIEKLREDVFEQENLIAGDSAMKEVKDAVIRIAPLEVTVLIEGETGTGKEVVARSLHRFSSRKDKSFVKINCGTIPENLIESELFGYEKGAFTGANREGKRGKVEMAEGGTLFLDEIGEMPLSMQVKLLDLLHDGSYTRVGGTKKRKVDARIIAATNRDLKEMCEEGLFRQDLYFRLNVVPLRLPPLREREGDIGVLTKYFISGFNKKYRMYKTISGDAIAILRGYSWPGNVRELEHVLERAFVMTEGSEIKNDLLRQIVCGTQSDNAASKIICTELMPLKEAKGEVERQLIFKAYDLCGSTRKVAETLGIDQSTVVKIMKKHKNENKGLT